MKACCACFSIINHVEANFMAKHINEMSEYLFVNTVLQDVSAIGVSVLTKSSTQFHCRMKA